MVTSPPPGAVVYAVPTYTTVVYVGSTPYHYVNGAYYKPFASDGEAIYMVVEDPNTAETA